jgi:hypothetical protein
MLDGNREPLRPFLQDVGIVSASFVLVHFQSCSPANNATPPKTRRPPTSTLSLLVTHRKLAH